MFTDGQINQLKKLLQPIEIRLAHLEDGQIALKRDVEELKSEVHHLQQGQIELRSDIKELQDGQAELKASLKKSQSEQLSIKRRLTRIEKDINSLGKYFDSHIIHQRLRIDRIENYLNLQ